MLEKNQLAKDWVAVLRLLKRSGQSVAEFCRQQGLPYGVVLRWRREARNDSGRAVEWVELESEAERESPTTKDEGGSGVGPVLAEMSLGGGVSIRIFQQEGGLC